MRSLSWVTGRKYLRQALGDDQLARSTSMCTKVGGASPRFSTSLLGYHVVAVGRLTGKAVDQRGCEEAIKDISGDLLRKRLLLLQASDPLARSGIEDLSLSATK